MMVVHGGGDCSLLIAIVKKKLDSEIFLSLALPLYQTGRGRRIKGGRKKNSKIAKTSYNRKGWEPLGEAFQGE